MNRYPIWKYILLAAILGIGLLYAAPNFFGEEPAVQILPHTGYSLIPKEKIEITLQEGSLPYKALEQDGNTWVIRFADPTLQMQARDRLQEELGDHYSVALHLASKTPKPLALLGAKPMKLGLDLRGGVHFLIAIDVESAIAYRLEGTMADVRQALRQEGIRYQQVRRQGPELLITFSNTVEAEKARKLLWQQEPHWDGKLSPYQEGVALTLALKANAMQAMENEVVEQTVTTLKNRVNELGVSEAVVQRQGAHHVVVELPGIQDPARAKSLLGKTATLSFHLYATEEAPQADPKRPPPPGTKWYFDREGNPYLLKRRVILSGDAITGALVGTDERSGRPAVQVRVSGRGLAFFQKTTLENIGNRMGVVYVETQGEPGEKQKTRETLINIATIQTALGSQFQVTGVSLTEAQDLALLLRAGALPAPVSIAEERAIGPSLGQENIRLGVLSIEIGMALVVLAMVAYYSVFGLIANLALCMNVVLLAALLSLLGATLTLPGMAGIVLTVGMAVDANVLIFERIREELKKGASVQSAISSGFDRALSTIMDANITTLIVVIILFGIGSGPIKGFAVTTSIGIMTSMLTAITGTRAMVNLAFGRRAVKQLPIGI